MSLYFMLTGVLVLSGLVMAGLTLAYHSPKNEKRRLRVQKKRAIPRKKYARVTVTNALFSGVLVFGFTWALNPFVIVEGDAPLLRVGLEGLAILAIYDALYYLVHRYLFHEWKILRRVHAVHHTVKYPTALDSLYLHPIENLIGLGLFWGSAALLSLLMGPVSAYAFAWSFCLYTVLNIAIHSGLSLGYFPLNAITHLTERHYKHHKHMRAKNYSSVSPTFDVVFRTEEP